MIVLSLFGGMECGRITLDRMGITPTQYYSAEIDKFAVAEVTANYPDVIHLGDVTRWREWDIPWGDIDLVIGGSPCHGFSFAGKQLAFDDPRSALFFEYVNILRHCQGMSRMTRGVKPWFMLENVRMKRQHLDVITEYLGVEPVFINSELVCAQNRQRYYWCNWSVPQPKDRGVLLVDILEDGGVDRDKAHCIDANYYKGGNMKSYFTKNRRQLVFTEKSLALLSTMYKENAKSMIQRNKKGWLVLDEDLVTYRKLTVIECCRLQGVPDDYFKVSSNTQAYKMLGNGWQVDTIEHIFNHCPLFTGGPTA